MQLPHNEAERLAALVKYGILDTDFEPTYDRVTRLAARMFSASISLVSLVDRNRQWFKSSVGLKARETPRDVAFCAHAILGDQVFVVPDATKDPRFAANPLVTGDPNVRFYAGAPLITDDGFALGTMCIIDRKPRSVPTDDELAMLEDFADIVMDLLEQRRVIKSKTRALDAQAKALAEIAALAGGAQRKEPEMLAADMAKIRKLATKS